MVQERSWRPENEDEEEDEIDETQYKSMKDAVIFAIEVSPSMLQTPPEPEDGGTRKKEAESPTSAALKCAYELMQQRIISNPNDMIGVLLYGTEESKFQEDQSRGGITYPHCYLLVDLCVPAAEDVKALRNMVEDSNEFRKLMRPSNEKVSMSNVLFCVNQIFTTKAPNFASRRLFLVTDEDDPHEAKKALKSAAAVRAKDLYDLGVTIELFPISKVGCSFNRSKFYNDIIYSNNPTDPDAPLPLQKEAKATSAVQGITLLQSLLSSIKSRAVAKRALFSNVPFEIGPEFQISVKGYIIFKKQELARKSYIWLKGEQAQIVSSHSGKLAADTGKEVAKTEVRKAYKFGGAQVTFTPDEINQLRNFGEPVIRVIGFKPQSLLPFWANVRPSTFIYPSEEDYVGSTRVFSALQQKLMKDKKMAIAWFVPRRNATPVIAAIIPGAEQENDDGDQVIPPGLWIVPLPFADDIRKNPETMNIVAPDPVIDRMRLIIQQLQLPRAIYAPGKYPNPSLQWHYKILQALALDEDVPTHPDDKTVPKYRQISKRAGSYIVEWGNELEAEHRKWQHENHHEASVVGTGAKRARAANVKEVPDRSKRIKTETDGVGGLTDQEVKKHWEKQMLNKLKNAELKDWLLSKGLSGAGKKAEMVERVEAYYETK